MTTVKSSGKLGLTGVQENINSVFFFKNNSIYARRQGDFVTDYQNNHNTVFGVDASDFRTPGNDKNTAIGYKTGYNENNTNIRNVFVGYQAGKNKLSQDSIYIGANTTSDADLNKYASDQSIIIGSDIRSKRVDHNVLIGHQIKNEIDDTFISYTTIVGAQNENTKNNTIIYGSRNKNSGTKTTIIGNNITNTGNNVLLINPKDSSGNNLTRVSKDNYVNIFGIIEGSNNALNFSQGIDFSRPVTFTSNISIGNNTHISSNLYVRSNAYIDNMLSTSEIVVNNVNITSNLHVTNSITVNSNVIIASNLSIGAELFIDGSNLKTLLDEFGANNVSFDARFNELNNDIVTVTSDVVSLEQTVNDANTVMNTTLNNFDTRITGIETTNTQLSNDVNTVKNDQLRLATNIDTIIEQQITNEFDSIIQKSIDGTYVFNIIRDSLTNFPSFAASANAEIRRFEDYVFNYGPMLNLDPAKHAFGIVDTLWNRETTSIQNQTDSLYISSVQMSNVIFHESNIFKNKTYFADKVFCSNNVAIHSNLFIKGAIQSYGDYVHINDGLLVGEALHVSDFIETNALKSDYNFNNYIKCFCNLSFSNDWYVFPRENPNNSNLRDLVFKGKNTIETTFTDFIPGQLNFTGQHRCSFSNIDELNFNDLPGRIVVSTGTYKDLDDNEDITIDDAIPIVTLSTVARDTRIFGVISGHEDETFPDVDNKRCFQIGTLKFKTTERKSKKIIVNAVGEGGIWVCGQNGDIENGDLIVTSDIPGIGMKQDDDIIRNYTVAKATCDVIFTDMNQMKFIGCIYKI